MATQLKEPEIVEPPETGQDIEPQSQARDWEAEARQLGWKPEGEFEEGERRPASFKDAETFVRDGEEKAGLQKETIAHLKQRLSSMERTMKRLTVAEQAAFQRGVDSVKAQMREAVANGDTETFEKLDKQLDQLRDAQTPQEDPQEAFDAFRDANDWYDMGGLASATAEQSRARILADRAFEKAVRQKLHETMTPAELFEKVKAEVIAQVPDLEKARPTLSPRKTASDVEGVSRPGNGKGTGAANLPPEARDQAIRFFESGVIKAKDKNEALAKYAKDYFAQ